MTSHQIIHKNWLTLVQKFDSQSLDQLHEFRSFMHKLFILSQGLQHPVHSDKSLPSHVGNYLFDAILKEQLKEKKTISFTDIVIRKVSEYVGTHDLTSAQPTESQLDSYYAPGENIPSNLRKLFSIAGLEILDYTIDLAKPLENTNTLSNWLISLCKLKKNLDINFIRFSYQLADQTSLQYAIDVNNYLAKRNLSLSPDALSPSMDALIVHFEQNNCQWSGGDSLDKLLKPHSQPICHAKELHKKASNKKHNDMDVKPKTKTLLKRHPAIYF